MLKCKFCHNEFPKLVNAHVIPRSFFKVTRGAGKHALLLEIDEKKLDRKTKQAGVSDNTMLCEGCERFFGSWDKHGFEAVVDMLNLKREFHDHTGAPIAYIATKAEYSMFKLFVLSVIWRASVSSIGFYDWINLGAHERHIQQMLARNDPGTEFDYPITCYHQTGHPYASTMLKSYQQRIHAVNYLRLYLPYNLIFLIKVDSRPLPLATSEGIIKSNGPVLFFLFPYFGSPEMEAVEGAKVLAKKHMGIPLKTVYRRR